MASRFIPQLTDNTSPQLTDFTYVAKNVGVGTYSDRKVSLKNLRDFDRKSRTVKKTSSYSVPISICDKRWLSNQGAAGTITFALPLTSEGAEIGFVAEEIFKVIILPKAGEKINPIGIVNGKSIESIIKGSSIYLRGYADGWHVVSEAGVWIVTP